MIKLDTGNRFLLHMKGQVTEFETYMNRANHRSLNVLIYVSLPILYAALTPEIIPPKLNDFLLVQKRCQNLPDSSFNEFPVDVRRPATRKNDVTLIVRCTKRRLLPHRVPRFVAP